MLLRLFLATLILFCFELGLFLLLLPWSRLWVNNFFLLRYPELSPYLLNHYLRGLISGLGLLDLGMSFWFMANFSAVVAEWTGEPPAVKPVRRRESLSRGPAA